MDFQEIFNKIKGQDPDVFRRWKERLHTQLVSRNWFNAYRTVVDQCS
jgi:hypothetical protein